MIKDKGEVQAHIRSLKENNSALTEINGHLEDKLFKVHTRMHLHAHTHTHIQSHLLGIADNYCRVCQGREIPT
jgi:hypothetical protein